MAAKRISTRFDPEFRTAIQPAEHALVLWRQRRKHREAIPQPLWDRMLPLARRYGLSAVAQALKVNYLGLKGRLQAKPPTAAPQTDNLAAGFVEVPMHWASAPQWVIELEDRGGSKLTVRLTAGESATALALAQGLWSQRR